MARFAEKQERIERLRAEASTRYPKLWSEIISDWNTACEQDRVWLTYSANYLFCTNNIRWAMDPLTLNWRLKEAHGVDVAGDLVDLSFVLLTHGHKDHLDLDLLSALRHLPITWVVPYFLLTDVMEQAGLKRQKILIPSPLVPFELNGIRILPFEGLHWETAPDGGRRGLPAMGYRVNFNHKSLLFPGDIREYRSSLPLEVESTDIIFAHLWLGRGAALLEDPPLLDDFCRFFLRLQPRRLILAHLNEFGRDASDFWDESHAQSARERCLELSEELAVTSVCMGESIPL